LGQEEVEELGFFSFFFHGTYLFSQLQRLHFPFHMFLHFVTVLNDNKVALGTGYITSLEKIIPVLGCLIPVLGMKVKRDKSDYFLQIIF